MAMTYCEYILSNPNDTLHKAYHDTEYGFPLHSDSALFERLILEINQAGLSWTTILKKKEAFHRAYDGFIPEQVAGYSEAEIARLMADASIIRNRRKIDATIENARRIVALSQGPNGSFLGWLDHHHPHTRDEWVRLFRSSFVFTGGEIVNEFLLSTGYLPGAHEPGCPVFAKIKDQNPPWMRSS
jgi:DNA-3-methyladenine glycosylase I